jgi:predicted NBD/HSP70 family sugar kinase
MQRPLADRTGRRPGPILGLDVGGTKIAGLLVDEHDRVLAELTVPTDERDLVEQVVDAARRILAESRASGAQPPAAIGIGVPGHVDGGNGTLRLAVNLEARELPLGRIVHDAFGVPCYLEHDARAAALWLHQQYGQPQASLGYLSVGTGISAALVIGGRLLRGAIGLAGEIGHVVADPNGPACVCGMRGCLEAVAAGPAVARMAAELGLRSEQPSDVFRAAQGGDARACVIAETVGAHLGRAVRALILSFGVDRVVIGGGMSRAGAALFDPILAELDRERASSPLARHALAGARIELLADPQAGARGAVSVARAGLERAHREGGPERAGREGEVNDD